MIDTCIRKDCRGHTERGVIQTAVRHTRYFTFIKISVKLQFHLGFDEVV